MSDAGILYTAQLIKRVLAAGKGVFENAVIQTISTRNHQEDVVWFFMETYGITLLCELL